MKLLNRCLRAAADPLRLRILNLLLHSEICVCDLQLVLKDPQGKISRHLANLKNAGLVEDRREGLRVYYSLSKAESAEHRALLEFLRKTLPTQAASREDLGALRKALKRGDCKGFGRDHPIPDLCATAAAPHG